MPFAPSNLYFRCWRPQVGMPPFIINMDIVVAMAANLRNLVKIELLRWQANAGDIIWSLFAVPGHTLIKLPVRIKDICPVYRLCRSDRTFIAGSAAIPDALPSNNPDVIELR